MPPDRVDPVPGPADPPDELSAALAAVLGHCEDEAAAAAAGRCHGTYRAREDRTVEALIGELGLLRAPATEPALQASAGSRPASVAASPTASPIDRRAAVDAATAASIGAFCRERAFQQELARHALDHALRGRANAIRLAAFVQAQTGKDTAAVVERHAAELAALLDRARGSTLRSGRTLLRPEDVPSADLAKTCRQAVDEWNAAGASGPCTVSGEACCPMRFDARRLRETVAALLQACGERIGAGGRFEVGIAHAEHGVLVTVEGIVTAPPALPATDFAAVDPASPGGRWPLVRLLAEQTAASHDGRLTLRTLPDRIAWTLMMPVPEGTMAEG